MSELFDLSELDVFFQPEESESRNETAAKVSNEDIQIPDGSYKVEVVYVDLRKSKQKKTPQLMWILKIVSVKYKDESLYKFNTLSPSKGCMEQLKQDLKICGVCLQKVSDLETDDIQADLVGTLL